jgi:hypothetical protein
MKQAPSRKSIIIIIIFYFNYFNIQSGAFSASALRNLRFRRIKPRILSELSWPEKCETRMFRF